jgi:hypothetical protein
MDKSGLSTSKVHCSRLKTSNIHDSKISELVNGTESGQYDVGESDEIVENFEFLSASSVEELAPVSQHHGGLKKVFSFAEQIFIRESDWEGNIITLNGLEFSGLLRINSNFYISPDSSPVDIFHLFFKNEVVELIQREFNLYTEQQINKKRKAGRLKHKSVCIIWKKASMQEIIVFC